MPTGVVLRDARRQLFEAAERVLVREGASGLTSRAVTDEAGVAKGVLHRHFDDFDDFLAELVRDRISALAEERVRLREAVGSGNLVSNVSRALTRILSPTALAMVALTCSRDGLRARLRDGGGLPLLTEACELLASYLQAERNLGRLNLRADPDALALTLIGTAHLLFAGELGGLPDIGAVEEIVSSILVGAEPGPGT